MTSTHLKGTPAPGDRWRRRLFFGWRTLVGPGEFTVLLIVTALLAMPALALNAAGWPLSIRTGLPVIILSVGFGFLLARSHYNELFALFIGGVYGVCLVVLIAALNEPGGLGQGVYSVFRRTVTWLIDAATGGINQDDLVFTLLVATLFWFLGYNAAWHVFRVDRVWRVILPPGFILVTNSVFYSGDADLDVYLLIFAFLALLLIVRSNLDAREWEWFVNGIRVPATCNASSCEWARWRSSVVLAWGIPTAICKSS
jgi:hypothetical protein